MPLLQTLEKKTVDKLNMTNDEMQEMQLQKLANTAVEIAAQVNKYVHRECQRKVNHGVNDPFMLEDMTMAYAVAMAKFSLFKVLPHDSRPTWEQMEEAAISAVKIAFQHCKIQMDAAPEHKPCIFTGIH